MLEEVFSFNEIQKAIDILEFNIKQQHYKLTGGAIEWIDNFKGAFVMDKAFGYKFTQLAASLMKEETIIEKNEVLQKRINDAANYFEPKFTAYMQTIKDHPIVTEHKEAAVIIDEYLQSLFLEFYTIHYYLQYCKHPFSVTSFLQHKLKFALPRINISVYASGKKQTFTDVVNPELYDTLKRWRDITCSETKQPIYIVANHKTLEEIATFLPLTKKDLLQINGFGKAKVDKYGDDILEAVENYCSRYNIKSNMAAKTGEPKKERKEKSTEIKIDTKTISFNLYKDGKKIYQIAQERNLTATTIESHLAHFVGTGEIDLSDFVDEKKKQLIIDAVAIHGDQSHKTLIENLPPDISYGNIKMVLAGMK